MSKLLCSLAFFSSLSLSSTVLAEQWLYRSPLALQNIFIIESSPDSYSFGDLKFEAEFCSFEEDYHCIKAEGFEFFVPKDLDSVEREWVKNNKHYTISTMKEVYFLGKKDEILSITQEHKDWKIQFLYSKENGLLGIGGIASDSSTGFYLLESKCGFAASKLCKN